MSLYIPLVLFFRIASPMQFQKIHSIYFGGDIWNMILELSPNTTLTEKSYKYISRSGPFFNQKLLKVFLFFHKNICYDIN